MERELIRWLRERLPQRENVLIGPGDDAAVLRASGNVVVTTDMLMDGVDFVLKDVDPRRVGHKALAVNLSDLAAMAAKPIAAFVSLCLPRAGGEDLAIGLYGGLIALAEEFDCSIAGGDVNSWDGPLVINVTAVGETTAKGPLLRSGARPGDAIMVTGSFGGSIHGRHLDVMPRVKEALKLHAEYEIHAATDVSDGLSIDLWNICTESNVGAQLLERDLPIHPDARQRSPGEFALSPLDRALGDGEDFELILAVPWEESERMLAEQPLGDVPLARIGQFLDVEGMTLVYKRKAHPQSIPLVPRGFEHRFDP
jgi:thiamine-monophosphate kinase